MLISIVTPVYKAPKILPELMMRLDKSLSGITDSYEVILVDDGCPWDSWSVISSLVLKYPCIKGIKMSRNFGQHYAITAGLDHATGDWVVVMDCDLQDQPEEIGKLLEKAMTGFDIVLAVRENRRDGFLKKKFSALFYFVLGYLTGAKFDSRIANFGIYSKTVIEAVKLFREPIRYFPGLIKHIGFKSTTVEIEHDKRFEGKTTYSFKKLLLLALDVILSYSDKPIKIIVKMGLCISFFSFLYVGYSIWQWYNNKILILGYTSIIASIWFLAGVTMSTLGVIGLYLAKTFDATKQRPIYLVEEIITG